MKRPQECVSFRLHKPNAPPPPPPPSSTNPIPQPSPSLPAMRFFFSGVGGSDGLMLVSAGFHQEAVKGDLNSERSCPGALLQGSADGVTGEMARPRPGQSARRPVHSEVPAASSEPSPGFHVLRWVGFLSLQRFQNSRSKAWTSRFAENLHQQTTEPSSVSNHLSGIFFWWGEGGVAFLVKHVLWN